MPDINIAHADLNMNQAPNHLQGDFVIRSIIKSQINFFKRLP